MDDRRGGRDTDIPARRAVPPRRRLLERVRRVGQTGDGAARRGPRLPGGRGRLPTRTAVPVPGRAREDVLAVYGHLIPQAACRRRASRWPAIRRAGRSPVSLMADARRPRHAATGVRDAETRCGPTSPSTRLARRPGPQPQRHPQGARRAPLHGPSCRRVASTRGDGRHSPVYRDLTGLNPLLIQAAGTRRLPRRQHPARRVGSCRGRARADHRVTPTPSTSGSSTGRCASSTAGSGSRRTARGGSDTGHEARRPSPPSRRCAHSYARIR